MADLVKGCSVDEPSPEDAVALSKELSGDFVQQGLPSKKRPDPRLIVIFSRPGCKHCQRAKR